MRILILGGGAFVGRALTEAATLRGHEVTTFTRSTLPPGVSDGLVEAVFGDRTDPNALKICVDTLLITVMSQVVLSTGQTRCHSV